MEVRCGTRWEKSEEMFRGEMMELRCGTRWEKSEEMLEGRWYMAILAHMWLAGNDNSSAVCCC